MTASCCEIEWSDFGLNEKMIMKARKLLEQKGFTMTNHLTHDL